MREQSPPSVVVDYAALGGLAKTVAQQGQVASGVVGQVGAAPATGDGVVDGPLARFDAAWRTQLVGLGLVTTALAVSVQAAASEFEQVDTDLAGGSG